MSKKRNKKECIKCGRMISESNFYQCNSPLFPDGRFHICRHCLANMFEESDQPYDLALIILHSMNKPFLGDVWKSSNDFGDYMRQINSLPQYRNLTWRHSKFLDSQEDFLKDNQDSKGYIDLDALEAKWGVGYSPEEYQLFERKYNMLKHNYPEKTSMHTEALLTYIRYRVKEELATARGDVKDAEAWGKLASKAAQDAKINPSQLSQSDLTGGLNTVGELVRAVEQVEDIIPILPKFKSRPQDKVDFAIWCYINYARDLEGKPLVDYEDVYRFYEERKKEYEKEFGNLEDGDS